VVSFLFWKDPDWNDVDWERLLRVEHEVESSYDLIWNKYECDCNRSKSRKKRKKKNFVISLLRFHFEKQFKQQQKKNPKF